MKAVLGRLSSLVGLFFFGLRDLGPAFQKVTKEISLHFARAVNNLLMLYQ